MILSVNISLDFQEESIRNISNFLSYMLTPKVMSAWSLQGNLRIGTLFQSAEENRRELPVVAQLIQVQRGAHPNSQSKKWREDP